MEKVKISIVSYLNTTPLIYGIEQDSSFQEQIELQKDIPSECARKLIAGEVDLGLVPVAVIPQLKEKYIITDCCIGAEGTVKSVLLLSEVPIQEIENIYLDYHSKTSVNLCKVLCREHWKIEPTFLEAKPGFEDNIKGTTAGVIIGDRTFHLPKQFNYQFDLAEEWKALTGLPFVFAAWVSNKELPQEFIIKFNAVLKNGLNLIDESIEAVQNLNISKVELKEYLTRYIKFDLDTDKLKGMNLFLSKLNHK